MNWQFFSEQMIYGLEITGTIGFAVSGALVAINRRLDFFGVVWLTLVTAVGGGIIRDVVLGSTPPVAFRDPVYVLVSLMTAGGLLLTAHFFGNFVRKGTFSMLSPLYIICDALGLGIFTVVGMNAAVNRGYGDNFFLMIFVGLITGIGGGMMRDVLAGITPTTLRRDIYAVASIAGAIVYIILLPNMSTLTAMLLTTAVIVTIRLLSIYHKVNLPIAGWHQQNKISEK